MFVLDSPVAFPLPGLCHCFALPPCVQHQNHTQAKERKPFALTVTVNDCTTGRRWQSVGGEVLPLVTANYQSRGPQSCSETQTLVVATKGIERHLQETILSYDFYTRHF